MKLSEQEKKWIAAIRKSGRFDRKFYRRWYGDDPQVRRNLERHYVTAGEVRGCWPCPEFCPEYYLQANPDVAEAGVSPFFHYVTSGASEERCLRPVPAWWKAAAEGLDFPPIESTGNSAGKARFAVVVHVFHYEMWPDFARRLQTLGSDCDAYITVTRRPNRNLDELIAAIQQEFPDAVILPHPNHGRDIFPFVRLVNSGVLSGYRAICKLHTKKSPHLRTGKAWSDHLSNSLLPGPDKSRELADQFLKKGGSGILTADGQRKSGPRWWHENRGRALALLVKAGISADPERLCFPAGSMYWLKPAVVESLRRLQLSAEDFEPELGQNDGTTAHAVERILGYLAEDEGLAVSEVAEVTGRSHPEGGRDSFEFCEPDNSPLEAAAATVRKVLPNRWLPSVSRHVRYEGALDFCSPRGVVGWIREVSDREVACRLRLTVDGVAICEGFADQHRADLGEPGNWGSCCGFTLPLPDQVFNGEVHGIQITVIGEAWLWRSLSVQARLARKEEVGEVTEVSSREVIGWCCDPLDPDFQQEVDLLIDGYFTGGTKPAFKGEPERGQAFRLEIPSSFRDGNEHDIEVVVRGSRICLWEGLVVLEA